MKRHQIVCDSCGADGIVGDVPGWCQLTALYFPAPGSRALVPWDLCPKCAEERTKGLPINDAITDRVRGS